MKKKKNGQRVTRGVVRDNALGIDASTALGSRVRKKKEDKPRGLASEVLVRVHGAHVGRDPNEHVSYFVDRGGQLARDMRRTGNTDSATEHRAS